MADAPFSATIRGIHTASRGLSNTPRAHAELVDLDAVHRARKRAIH